jgi:hypothetical protein
VPLDDEVEAELEDGVIGGPRVRVGEGVAGRFELLEEPPRNGDVESAQLCGEGLDLRPL